MIEIASVINNYLPIRKSPPEEEYVGYLWSSFELLATNKSAHIASFSITAFHLLFMVAVQYKALRIYKELPEEYKRAFTLINLRKDQKSLVAPTLVFDFSPFQESTIFQLFEIVGFPKECVKGCKNLIKERNTVFMHASGGIKNDPEQHIESCLNRLSELQNCFTQLNDVTGLAWESDLETDEDPFSFLDARLFDSGLTLADFKEGELARVFGAAIEENT